MNTRAHRRRSIAGWALNVGGTLLLLAAAIHFLAIPILRRVLASNLPSQAHAFVAPPFFLNHTVVGILLLPIAFSTFYCARGVRSGQLWAWRIGLANALAILILPEVLLIVMGVRYFRAVPFLVAALSITGAGLLMTIPLIWARNEITRNVPPASG